MYSTILAIVFGALAGLIASLTPAGKGFGIIWNMLIGAFSASVATLALNFVGFNTADSNWTSMLVISLGWALILLIIANHMNYLRPKDDK